MSIGISVRIPDIKNRMASAIRSLYSVEGKDPKLVADFDDEYYRANGGSTTFSDLITHARAGNATMTDSDGLIKWAPHNLLTYSEDFSQWSLQANVNLTDGQSDPESGTSATLYNIAGSVSRAVDQSITFSEANYTFAIWVKAVVDTKIKIRSLSSPWDEEIDILASSGWTLITSQQLMPSGTYTIGFFDSSGGTGDRFYVYGAHLYRSDLGGMVDNPDRGDSYVPTTSSAVYLPRRGHHVYNGYEWVNEGVLAESEARTNLITYSNSVASWTDVEISSSYTANSITGLSDAILAIPSINTALHFFSIASATPTANTANTASIYAKASGYSHISIEVLGFNSNYVGVAKFDLDNGVAELNGRVTGSANLSTNIQDIGSGWYRCSISCTMDDNASPTSTPRLNVIIDDDGTSFANWAGDGVSGVFLYNAQFESASTPSSLIPTSGSSVTRAAETFTIPSAKLPWPTPQYIGDELVTNGTFDDASDWTLGTNASISGGKLNYSGGSGNGDTYQNIGLVVGKVYWGVFTVSNVTSGSVKLRQGGTTAGGTIGASSDGTYSSAFVIPSGANANLIVDVSGDFVGSIDAISVREVNPLSVSIQQQGRITYADTDSLKARIPLWQADGSNWLGIYLDTRSTETGQIVFEMSSSGVYDSVASDGDIYSPNIYVPFNVAGRYGSTFINGAIDGVALTVNTTPTSLPDLSTTDLPIATNYMGTIKTFRIWDKDLTDTGIAEATAPSLEPSLSLSFDSTESSFVDKGWSE